MNAKRCFSPWLLFLVTSSTGFSRGDETSANAQAIPTILVLLNGSARAVNWANENVPAILEAWYPDGEGGPAVAEALHGDFSPAGRLPVTFYKSAGQLPAFEDYSMASEEVVQLYLTHEGIEGAPRRALEGFERVALGRGEHRAVSFTWGDRDLSVVDPSGKRRIMPGKVEVWVGGGEPLSLPGTPKRRRNKLHD